MNLFWILLASLPLLELTEGTVQFKTLPQDLSDAPLALIRKKGSSRFELASPVNYETETRWNTAVYAYNDSADEHGPAEEFRIACPSPSYEFDQLRIEEEWETKSTSSTCGRLLFVEENDWMKAMMCEYSLMPSVQKITDEEGVVESCGHGQSQAEMWGVGFPISDTEGKNPIQFLPAYKVCHSDNKGLLYTIHHLNSPNLLLLKLWEYYELNPVKNSYSSVLDPKQQDKNMASLYENHFAYQFVSDDDMPTKNLHRTTFYRLNYFPIPKHRTMLRGMIRADNYIRLYSKETKKPLTIYSGTSKKTILRKPHHCAPEFVCKPVPFEVDFFWRIIKDEQNNAILLVTQLTPVRCDEKTYICHENLDVLLKYWWHGGCIYTCSVNTDVIELLQLPSSLDITGTLDLSFTKKMETQTTEAQESPTKLSFAKPSAKTRNTNTNMHDFMTKATFMLALSTYDPGLAETVHDQTPPESHGFLDMFSGGGGGHHDGGSSWWDGGWGGGEGGGGGGGGDDGGAGGGGVGD